MGMFSRGNEPASSFCTAPATHHRIALRYSPLSYEHDAVQERAHRAPYG
jgi:hypothetical protein